MKLRLRLKMSHFVDSAVSLEVLGHLLVLADEVRNVSNVHPSSLEILVQLHIDFLDVLLPALLHLFILNFLSSSPFVGTELEGVVSSPVLH